MTRQRYGKTKAAVLDGHSLGMTIDETAEMSNIPANCIRYTAHRLGLRMKGVAKYAKYGSVKDALHAAFSAGMTYAEAEAKYNVSRVQLQGAAKASGCYLKPSKHRNPNA